MLTRCGRAHRIQRRGRPAAPRSPAKRARRARAARRRGSPQTRRTALGAKASRVRRRVEREVSPSIFGERPFVCKGAEAAGAEVHKSKTSDVFSEPAFSKV